MVLRGMPLNTVLGQLKIVCCSVALLLLALSSVAVAGNDTSGVLLSEVDARAAIVELRAQHAGIDTFSAVTVQRKTSALLAEEVRTEGNIVLKKPNLLRWEIQRPTKLIIVADGTAMWIYRPDKKEAEKRILSDDVVARYAMEFFSSTMAFSMERLSKRFLVEIYKGHGGTVLKLRPRSKMAARHMESLSIWYRGGDGAPEKLVLRSKNKGTTITEFKDVSLNVELGEDQFTLALPKDVLVLGMEEDEDF